MDTPLKVEFKIGQIEFKAEGNPIDVEKQRESFVNTLLPLAVEAMVRTHGTVVEKQKYIEATNAQELREGTKTVSLISTTGSQSDEICDYETINFSRESLNTYINKFGSITDREFVVLSIYFEEMKTGQPVSITSEDLKQYYKDARRTKYSNLSQLLTELVKKGLLKDDEGAEKKTPKPYILTNDGLKFAREFTPKPVAEAKPKTPKRKKSAAKSVSIYSNLTADDLSLKNYPEIKSQNSFKKKMILTLYIVSKEGKGDTFSVADIQYLLTEMLGLPASIDQIKGVFKENKSWFKPEQDSTNKKAYRRKLLQGAKDFAESIINNGTENK
jgi:DNA-binding PadR family transcriptional regulator